MTPHNLNGNTVLMVRVPKGSKNFTVIQSHVYFDSPRLEHSIGGVDLPKTTPWEIVGKGLVSEITEGEADNVVHWHCWLDDDGNHFSLSYKDYMDVTQIARTEYKLNTALESLHSFIRSHGYEPTEIVLLIEKK